MTSNMTVFEQPTATKEEKALLDILKEYRHAKAKFPERFKSGHEGYAVILEELDELWEEVKKDGINFRKREECVQVAAMALRFILELC